MEETYPKQRTVKTEGKVMHLWGRVMHNWEGPALIDLNDPKKSEYYVFGIKYSKEKWLEAKKDQIGLPFFKTSTGKQSGERF